MNTAPTVTKRMHTYIPSHRHFPTRLVLGALLLWLMSSQPGWTMDLTGGLMYAVPAPNGTPSLSGADTGWDLTSVESMWVDPQNARLMHAKYALNYDENNLYVYARVSLPNRKLANPNSPTDSYYIGDMIEFRVCSDPSIQTPLNRKDPATLNSNRICHMSFWKDTAAGQTYFAIAYGDLANSKGNALNPPGSKVAITEGAADYVVQAIVPWSALNVPGGKNPFAPGSRMTGIWAMHWGSNQSDQYPALYTQNPGGAAYNSWDKWGLVEFSPTGNLKSRHPTMEAILSDLAHAAPVGIPITIEVPSAGKLLLAGLLRVQGSFNGITGIVNSGTLTIRGEQVVMERLPGRSMLAGWYGATINSSQILNQPGGLVQGVGTFTYTNSTENPEGRYLRLVNLGSISPGGDQPGQLTLANVNVQFGEEDIQPTADNKTPSVKEPGLLRIQILGPAKYSSLRVTGTGDTGRFDLADGVANTLNVVTPDGVLPRGTYRIVTAAAVKGTFATLQYNGKAPVPYTVQYLPDGITVEVP